MTATLPLRAVVREASAFLGAHLHVAALLFGPLAVATALVTAWSHGGSATARWAPALLLSLLAIPSTTAWQRRLLRGQAPGEAVGLRVGREERLALVAWGRTLVFVALATVPLGLVAALAVLALRALGPTLGYEATVGALYLVPTLASVSLLTALAPLSLLTPAASVGRALGGREAGRLAAGSRGRLALVSLVALPTLGAGALLALVPGWTALVVPVLGATQFVCAAWGGALDAASYRALTQPRAA